MPWENKSGLVSTYYVTVTICPISGFMHSDMRFARELITLCVGMCSHHYFTRVLCGKPSFAGLQCTLQFFASAKLVVF